MTALGHTRAVGRPADSGAAVRAFAAPLATRSGLVGDDRRRDRARTRLRGGDREAVSRPPGSVGAAPPLREAGPRLPGPLFRSRDRAADRLPLPGPAPR